MLNIFIYFFFMWMMFLISVMLSMVMYMEEMGVMMEWLFFSVNSLNIEFLVLLDWISLMFISLIFLISSMILMYSYVYMHSDLFISRFIYLMILFIMSMIFMIISPNMISILLGWDGLGLVSYCLVIYYQNYMSYNSGMITVLSNRIGDVGILMAIGLMMVNGSWSMFMLSNEGFLIMVMLLVAAITKSAQIPFSTWLPMAMAAPTPVSALVHSSTLVTAGVYLMIRFSKFLMDSELNLILLFLSVLTMLMSGLMALVENDLKKIIALSTLSQLGLMMMILSVGFSMVAFYHLLTHAIFKSLLFMCAGVIIHSMSNSQDIRVLGNMNEFMPFIMMSLYISNMALCGFPFLAGFYSKDLIMELVYSFELNIFMMGMIIVALVLTVMYSFRLFYYLFFSELKFYSYYKFKEDWMMNISMVMLILMSMMVGSLLNWLFFFDFYLIFVSVSIKMGTLMVCLGGVVMGYILVVFNIFKGMYMLNYFLSSMWFLSYFYLWIYRVSNNASLELYGFDKMWMEFLMKGLLSNLVKVKSWKMNYKIYMFMKFFILLSVYVFLSI